ncbi:MAG: peroxide stress protein YaaA [Actinomycetaceae bacterium]|nr:peroxide stress protein YaaA [Actinomycetaceae bacterium]
MIILAPPSERKTTGTHHQTIDLIDLPFNEQLLPMRQRVLEALVTVSKREDALQILHVGPKVADTVAANIDIVNAPTSPALFIYSGVFYDALDAATLSEKARASAQGKVFVQSALWGLVGLEDYIPAYRLSMGIDMSVAEIPAVIPGKENGDRAVIGKLSTAWKPVLAPVLDDLCGKELVIDCRSGAYRAPWKPTAAQRQHIGCEMVDVRAVVQKNGGEKVVTHYTKFYRGLLTRHMMMSDSLDIVDVADMVDVLAHMKDPSIADFRLEESGPQEFTLTLIVSK